MKRQNGEANKRQDGANERNINAKLLADPQWTPYLVLPGEYVAPERVVTEVPGVPGKRPLFVLLDATWSAARKMFRKSPYLDHLPVLSLQPEQLSRYRMRPRCWRLIWRCSATIT